MQKRYQKLQQEVGREDLAALRADLSKLEAERNQMALKFTELKTLKVNARRIRKRDEADKFEREIQTVVNSKTKLHNAYESTKNLLLKKHFFDHMDKLLGQSGILNTD